MRVVGLPTGPFHTGDSVYTGTSGRRDGRRDRRTTEEPGTSICQRRLLHGVLVEGGEEVNSSTGSLSCSTGKGP